MKDRDFIVGAMAGVSGTLGAIILLNGHNEGLIFLALAFLVCGIGIF